MSGRRGLTHDPVVARAGPSSNERSIHLMQIAGEVLRLAGNQPVWLLRGVIEAAILQGRPLLMALLPQRGTKHALLHPTFAAKESRMLTFHLFIKPLSWFVTTRSVSICSPQGAGEWHLLLLPLPDKDSHLQVTGIKGAQNKQHNKHGATKQ